MYGVQREPFFFFFLKNGMEPLVRGSDSRLDGFFLFQNTFLLDDFHGMKFTDKITHNSNYYAIWIIYFEFSSYGRIM